MDRQYNSRKVWRYQKGGQKP